MMESLTFRIYIEENASLARFCRQYLQLETQLDFPPDDILREEHVQEALHDYLFSDEGHSRPAPPRYQLRILKELLSRIESSIHDWELHGVSDALTNRLSALLSSPLQPEIVAAQEKSCVTYTLSLLKDCPQITLLESRSLIASAGTTGLRTWEAALHLGQYLCRHPDLVRGKRVLELGAGTGYLSILCAKFFEARQVLATDGSDNVLANLPDNLFLNGLEETGVPDNGEKLVSVKELKWGHALVSTDEEAWSAGNPIDLVLGADVTYDASVIPALIGTLQELFEKFSNVQVLIAATERNQDTFLKFLEVCKTRHLSIEMIRECEVLSRSEQMGPFYGDGVPVWICRISRV